MPDCHHCGAAADPRDAYCVDCGTPLDGDPARSRATAAAERPDGELAIDQHDGRQSRHQRSPPGRATRHTHDADGLPEPDGLRLACGLLAILGASSAIGGVTAVQAQRALGAASPPGFGVAAGGGLGVTGLLLLALGGAYVLSAYGLWTATDWAWTATIGVTGVGAVINLTGPASPGTALFAAIGSGGLCAYLLTAGDRFRPSVRREMAAAGSEASDDGRQTAENF